MKSVKNGAQPEQQMVLPFVVKDGDGKVVAAFVEQGAAQRYADLESGRKEGRAMLRAEIAAKMLAAWETGGHTVVEAGLADKSVAWADALLGALEKKA